MPIRVFLLALFILSLVFIPESFSNTPNQKVDLSLTPLACFVKKSGDVCHITVKINWQSESPIDACLYQNDEKMHCWSSTRNATKKITVSLSENMQFTLQGDNNVVYAQQHVAIAASTSKKYRRRLRADWSLF